MHNLVAIAVITSAKQVRVCAPNAITVGCDYSRSQKSCERHPFLINYAAPEYPEIAREAHLAAATVVVRVTIAPNNTVTAIKVVNSSGSSVLDRAAITVARKSTFGAAIHHCKRVQSSPTMRIDLDPEQ